MDIAKDDLMIMQEMMLDYFVVLFLFGFLRISSFSLKFFLLVLLPAFVFSALMCFTCVQSLLLPWSVTIVSVLPLVFVSLFLLFVYFTLVSPCVSAQLWIFVFGLWFFCHTN